MGGDADEHREGRGGKKGRKRGMEGARDGLTAAGGKRELVDDVLARGESRPDAILSGFPRPKHSLWPAGLRGWCFYRSK